MGLLFKDNSDFIAKLKKGDEKAYADLVDMYNHKLCLYADSLLNDIPLSEDVVQDVFIKIWERRHYLRADASLKSYLYKSVYNSCINQHKKNQSVTALEKKYIDGLDQIVEKRDEHALERIRQKVTQAIDNLPSRCKEVFMLSKKEGLTNMEIAAYLDVSTNTIERQITIAFSKIREEVGNKTDLMVYILIL